MKVYNTIKAVAATLILMLAVQVTANAQTFGCKVFFCLGDPRGPTAEPYCVSVIAELKRELAKGHSFPTCDSADSGGMTITSSFDWFDLCPEGTIAFSAQQTNTTGTIYVAGGTAIPGCNGTHKQSCYSIEQASEQPEVTARVCIKPNTYQGAFIFGGGEAGIDQTHYVYRDLIVLPRQATNVVYDVYLHNKLYHRTRLSSLSQ